MSDKQRADEQVALEKIRELEKKLETKLREKEKQSKVSISAFRAETMKKIRHAEKELARAKSDLEELETGAGTFVERSETFGTKLAQALLAKQRDKINSMADQLFEKMIGKGNDK